MRVCMGVFMCVWKDNCGSFLGVGEEGQEEGVLLFVGSAAGEPLHLQLNYKLQVYTLYAYT